MYLTFSFASASSNGTELSSKDNRELALQVQSDGAYHPLTNMYVGDWPNQSLLPVVFFGYQGPEPHVLISEVLYNPSEPDDAEFIELVNPTPQETDISAC